MDVHDNKLRVRLAYGDLLCKNRCGFYGTKHWNGLCSKCWRLHHTQPKKTIDHDKNRSLLSRADKQDDQPGDSRISRFKAMLKKSPSMFTSKSPSSVSPPTVSHSSSITSFTNTPETTVPPAVRLASYATENFGNSVAHEIDRQCRDLIDKITFSGRLPLDDISEFVQNFYQVWKEKLTNFRPGRSDLVNAFMALVEEYICTEAYDMLFSDRADEEAADLSIQDRIRSLHWVTSGFLETAFDFDLLDVHRHIDEAVTYVIDMNRHRTVHEKLDSLVSCSNAIFNALKESNESRKPASADEYLPALIYVILCANPPLILSNMKFISRFALPNRIMLGESGYYFTNLSCALQFIQEMNAESLKMNKEEFEAYTSGRLGVPRASRDSEHNLGIRTLENVLKRFDALIESQSRLDDRVTLFSGRMEENCESYAREVQALHDAHPSAEVLEYCKLLHASEDDVSPLQAIIRAEKEKASLTVDNDSTGQEEATLATGEDG